MFLLNVGENKNVVRVYVLSVSQQGSGDRVDKTLIGYVGEDESFGSDKLQPRGFGHRDRLLVASRENL